MQSSKLSQLYLFGDAMEISSKTLKTDTIDGKTEHWYFSKNHNCWLFGGYLFLEAGLSFILSPETIACNNYELWPGKDYQVFTNHYITGEFFDGALLADSSCPQDDESSLFYKCSKITIGNISNINGVITFSPVFTYYTNPKIKKVNSSKIPNQGDSFSLKKYTDNNGDYYVDAGSKEFSREEAAEYCIKSKVEF